jgi:hypothetical protein
MIGTDCIGRCKSNYHMITTTMAPCLFSKLEDQIIEVDKKFYVFIRQKCC